MDHLTIAKLLDSRRPHLVERIVALALPHSEWAERLRPNPAERLALDCDHDLATLAKAVRYRSPMIFDDYLLWRRGQLQGQGLATGHLRELCGHCWAVLSEQLPAESQPTLYDFIQAGLAALVPQSPLLRQVAAAQDQLAEGLVAAATGACWHWQAAYADDPERLLREAWFLFDYAVDAHGGRGELLGRHLRVLREQAYRRGLATVHLQQLIWLAAGVAEAQLEPVPASELRRLFEGAAGHLAYDDEGCLALLAAQEQLVAEVVHELSYAGLVVQPEQAALEVGWCLAYLADAMAVRDPAPLAGYARRYREQFASLGQPDLALRQSLSGLDSALERHLPQYAAHAARGIVGVAQRGL